TCCSVMDQVLQASQKLDHRGSLEPSCQSHRARTAGFSRQLWSMTARSYLASHQCRYDGDHEFLLRHVHHLGPYGQTHGQSLWQSIHPRKFYLHLEDQLDTGLDRVIFSRETEPPDIPQYGL